MKGYIDIRLCCITLLILLLAGCSEKDGALVNEPVVEENASFVMYINLPDEVVTTRSEGDNNISPDRPYEQAIHSLRVWAFAREDNQEKTLIAIDQADASDAVNGVLYKNFGTDEIRRYAGMMEVVFKVKDSFNKYKCLDVYVIANAESLGYADDWGEPTGAGLSANEQWLETIQIGADCFGIGVNMVHESNATGELIPADKNSTGLPMSGYIKEVDIFPEDILFTIIKNIQLKRAVSKIRFVFAKSPSMKDAEIKGVTLSANMIPNTEWLFTGTTATSNIGLNNPSYGPAYYGEIDFGHPEEIKNNLAPSALEWNASANRLEWEAALNKAIANGEATEHVRAYLHESPNQLVGSITYNLHKEPSSPDKTVTFTMARAGEFLRNGSWTIFAYFTEGGLIFEVANWENQEVTFKPFI